MNLTDHQELNYMYMYDHIALNPVCQVLYSSLIARKTDHLAIYPGCLALCPGRLALYPVGLAL